TGKLLKEKTIVSEFLMDVKAVCLIYSKKGVDTLSFGVRSPYMIYNGKFYQLDTDLLKNLAQYLPESEKKSIQWYLRILRNHSGNKK
ncbi:MAG: hypothetical protein V4642_11415, partial [Bacteroidota bacterium]